MDCKIKSARVTLWAIRIVYVILAVLAVTMPTLLRLYARLRLLNTEAFLAVLVAFYCCGVVSALALWRMDRLVRNILKNMVFVPENVRLIRQVYWCCGGVSLICLPTSVQYPPLIFVVGIMAFLCLVVRVTAELMDAAIAIREENDLTV